MSRYDEHLGHPFFAFNQDNKSRKSNCDICAVYGEGAVVERTARGWHADFKNTNFDPIYAHRSRRPVDFDEGRLNQVLTLHTHIVLAVQLISMKGD